MSQGDIPPSINETAFVCPFCNAFTTQHWYKLHADRLDDNCRTPVFFNLVELKIKFDLSNKPAIVKEQLRFQINEVEAGRVFFTPATNSYPSNRVENLFLSECYNCKKVVVWVHKNPVFPSQKVGVVPNTDIPADIVRDFEEARSILNQSPRGAVALLRLCVQKLCAFLGEEGKSIDKDIASLVSKGLNPMVQQSLDIVRVIGNEAVHPGVIDLRDDRHTAIKLLNIINLIADQMITHPKAVKQMYDQLPEEKRKAIDCRNEKAAIRNQANVME